MRMLTKHSYVFFIVFTLSFLSSIFFYLIINNEYKSIVFTILQGVYHTGMTETFLNANARMVHMVHTMIRNNSLSYTLLNHPPLIVH